MSEMISGCSNVYGKQVIEIPLTEIVVPRFKSLIRPEKENVRLRLSNLQVEQAVVMRLVQKLGQKQLQQIKQMKIKIIQDKFERLKRKMRKSAEDQTNKNSIEKFFKIQKSFHGSALAECMSKQRCDQIEISKKYGTKIFNNLATIHEIATIQKQKETYRNWLNEEKNSPIKSPIFTRMSFVLEHTKKQKDTKMMNGQIIFSHQNSVSFFQRTGKSQKSKNQKYVARQKQKRFL